MWKYRKEEREKYRNALIIVIVAILIMCGVLYEIIIFRDNENRNQLKETLHTANEYYVKEIQQVLQNDIQILEGTSLFLKSDVDSEDVVEIIEEEKEKHDFLEISFVDTSYCQYVVNEKSIVYHQQLEATSFITQALQGETSISEVSQDETTNEYVFSYAVPLYKDDKIEGAIVATVSINRFTSIIQVPLQKNGKVLLVDGNGNVIIASNWEQSDNFYESVTINEQTNKRSIDMSDTEYDDFTFLYEDVMYLANIQSVEYQDWSLIAAVSTTNIDLNYMYTTIGLAVFAVFVIVLFVILLLYINHMIFKGKKNVHELAYYDSLTKAFNKNGFEKRASELLHTDSKYTLVVLNIHDFKFINHSFGYDMGNKLLLHITKVLQKNLTENETFYHREGDHFAFLMYTQDKKEIGYRVKKIMEKISAFDMIPDKHYPIYAYCGIKICHMFSTEVDLGVMLDRAYLAQAEVHDLHGNGYAFYDEMMFKRAQHKNEVEQRMRYALDNREFQLYIQPKYHLKDECLYSGEALVRWVIEEEAKYYPDAFIPVFEQNGFIAKLDLYMLEILCAKMKEWKEKGYDLYPISLNQSRLLFFQEHYVDTVKEIVERYEIDPSYLILEITEGLVTYEFEELTKRINQLHALGFQISMDDFGSGYSSLNVLRELPINELKLDRVFLMKTDDEHKRHIIMHNIISMAKQLGMKTVCEGVETLEQVKMLQEMQCDIAQGYYYSKPISVDEFEILAYGKINIKL